MLIEFRGDFRGEDVLIITGGPYDMQTLSDALYAWSTCPNDTLVSSMVPACEGGGITLQAHDSSCASTASDSPAGVIWRIGEDAARHLADLIGQLSRHPRPAHLSLDFEGYARTIIISMDEY
ncbi:hypothetical protein [Xanthomonas sacchari]|uniref:hypothetical protein n=1 Tax=Xanthomonas sacchari TaxID=56458 RepID=UPI0022597238|nr:hypothetical protein [Xanthomonas sacchari]UYK73954.1 hypothetical protein NG828_06410 [Xanthomonas sacchari]